jgi:hypothetical protein
LKLAPTTPRAALRCFSKTCDVPETRAESPTTNSAAATPDVP